MYLSHCCSYDTTYYTQDGMQNSMSESIASSCLAMVALKIFDVLIHATHVYTVHIYID